MENIYEYAHQSSRDLFAYGYHQTSRRFGVVTTETGECDLPAGWSQRISGVPDDILLELRRYWELCQPKYIRIPREEVRSGDLIVMGKSNRFPIIFDTSDRLGWLNERNEYSTLPIEILDSLLDYGTVWFERRESTMLIGTATKQNQLIVLKDSRGLFEDGESLCVLVATEDVMTVLFAAAKRYWKDA